MQQTQDCNDPKRKSILIALLGLLAAAVTQAGESLEQNFVQPPMSARPWVYWFPLSGNLTKDGITADLEAMARVGIGGALYMETDQGAPVGAADFGGPLWMEMFGHACREAKRLGLQLNMNNDAGWCGSGGPWITPEMSMQKLVWSEALVEQAGPVVLPQPAAVHGYYQDIAVLAMPAPSAETRIADIAGKASFLPQHFPPLSAQFTEAPAAAVIARERVIDISSHMSKDGKLTWTPPPGKWLVMRFGHTTTGKDNHPAPATGRGLECDKFSKQAATLHFDNLMGKLIRQNQALTGETKTLVSTHIDSWEVGSQNWTPRMREEFRARRGYDLLPFLPAFAGRIVGGSEITERFLWDLRQTVSELLIQNYAGTFHALAKQNGIRLSIEAYDAEPADDMAYAGQADEPMGEFWSWARFSAAYSCTEMASAAHTYGKRILGAEAFTATDAEKWQGHPANIKDLGDWAFCEGVNRFVFHRYAAQPWIKAAPGMSMGPWGLHYERTQTWWEQSKAWHLYLTRCQNLLRQGLFVADIAYLAPEGAPRRFAAPPEAEIGPHIRGGYDFDGCSADVVLTRMNVKDGRLVLPDGMSYRTLVLPEVDTMTPALLEKIRQLADAGAMIVGPANPPRKAPGLSDMGAGDEKLRKLAAELWASGKILTGKTAQQQLAGRGVPPDFAAAPLLRHIHRRIGEADVYFVANPQHGTIEALAAFRVSGKQPELWWPDSGRMESSVAFQERDGVTRLRLRLEPSGSVFVVFRKPSAGIDPVVALRHDGETLWALDKPQSTLKISKATYGIPGDPQRTRDVTLRLQGIVDTGERHIRVTRLAEGDDPALGVVKTLSIEYVAAGNTTLVSGTDPDTLNLTDDALPVKITKATYGLPGDAPHSRDVRAKLQLLADHGERTFEVASLAHGDDPAFGLVKTLELEYTLGGKSLTASGTDADSITLTAMDLSDPLAELRGESGATMLSAWRSGRYELQSASGKTHAVTLSALPAAVDITGPWQVRFDPAAGGPGEVTFPKLEDWAQRPEDGIRYYSGTAVYRTTFVAAAAAPSTRWLLDLGKVEVMAEMTLNGKALGIAWKPPYRIDVTSAIQAGENRLELKVVNLWINRQIGDENLPEDSERNPNGTLRAWPAWVQQEKPSPTGRISFTSWRLWKKGDRLQPSGLLGPVRLLPVAQLPVP